MAYENFKTPSRTSPRNGRRGCLCENNTYHVDCCDGSLQAQGIGNIYGMPHLLTEFGDDLLQENFGLIGIEGVPPYIPPPLTEEEQAIIDAEIEAERIERVDNCFMSNQDSNSGPDYAKQEAYKIERNLNNLPNNSSYSDYCRTI